MNNTVLSRPTDDLSNVKSRWFDDNASLTNFMYALSSLFPNGESFFMKSITAYMNDYPDLKPDIITFCKQERNHTLAHEYMNSSCDVEKSKLIKKLADQTGTFILDSLVEQKFTKRQKLLLTTCLEHITATIAEQLLIRDDLNRRIEPKMRKYWLYHADEETSVPHKNVAYNIYSLEGINNFEKNVFMVLATLSLIAVVFVYWTRLMWQEKTLNGVFSMTYKLFNPYNGFITMCVPEYIRFFRKDFYPVKYNDFFT